MTDADFGALMLPVAKVLFGEPSKEHSSRGNPRWGTNGAFSVDEAKGVWTDWSNSDAGGNAESGGVIDLVMREKHRDKAGALTWLEEQGFIPERKREQESEPARSEATKKPVVRYPYTNADGDLLYEVVRFHFMLPGGSFEIDPKTGNPKKTFSQRRPDGHGGYIWNLEGIGHTIYRHERVELAIAEGKTVYLPEGEKDVHSLEEWGLVASTNSGGADNWTDKLAALFKGADVVVLVDNDEKGRVRGEKVARSLRGIAARVRVLDFAPHWSAIKDKFDVSDWKAAGGTKEQLLDIVAHLHDWTPAPPVSKFGATQFEHIGRDGVAYDWLIKGIIARGEVFIVAGEMQSGKSFLTIDMGMKVATNVEYCGRKVKQGLVIYVACEDGKGVELRAEGYRREHGLENKAVPFVVMTKKLSLMEDKGIDEFIAECLQWEVFFGIKLELIFIDTFSVATEGLDEIHSGDVGKVLGRVNRISEQCKAAVGLVHHLNADGKRVRGHSSMTANVSQVIEVRPLQKPQPNRNLPAEFIKDADGRLIRRARLVKNKNGPNTEGWQFVLRQIKLGDDRDGYPITTCVLEQPSGGSKEAGTTGRLSQDQKLVLNALTAAIEDVGIDMPTGVRVGPQIKRAVAYKDWVEQVRKTWTFKAPEDEQEQRAKELRDVMIRVGKALINGEYMGRDNDRKIVWSLNKDDRPRKTEPKPEPARPKASPHMSAADMQVPF